jgi:hypothetical protein
MARRLTHEDALTIRFGGAYLELTGIQAVELLDELTDKGTPDCLYRRLRARLEQTRGPWCDSCSGRWGGCWDCSESGSAPPVRA